MKSEKGLTHLSLTCPGGVCGLLKHHHRLVLIHLFLGHAALCNISLHTFSVLCSENLTESTSCSRITTLKQSKYCLATNQKRKCVLSAKDIWHYVRRHHFTWKYLDRLKLSKPSCHFFVHLWELRQG